MKRIGLVIAAAMLGTTGLASAGIAVHQFAASDGSNSVALDAKTEQLAANCWVATGAGNAAECKTSAAAPGLAGLDIVTGLVDAQDLVQTAQGVAGRAVAAAGEAATQAAAASPLDCNVSAGVPSGVVPPVGSAVPKPVTDAAGKALQTVGSVTGINVATNGSGTTAVGCGANTSGTTAAAADVAGSAAAVGNKVVGGVAKAGGKVVDDAVTAATGAAGDAVDAVEGVTGGVATAGQDIVTGVTDDLKTTVSTVTGTVSNLLGGGVLNCSASGGASTGLLGSVSISGSC